MIESLNAKIESQNKTIKTEQASERQLKQIIAANKKQLDQCKSNLTKFKLDSFEDKLLLMDTLNVKLRYEKIIQTLLEREKFQKKLDVKKLVRETVGAKKVIIVSGKELGEETLETLENGETAAKFSKVQF